MTIAIDTKAGTHFNGVKINVSRHARLQAAKRFNMSDVSAGNFIAENLRKASFIGEVIGDDGNNARLYGYRRIAFVVASTNNTVLTVYQQDTAPASVYKEVHRLVNAELARMCKLVSKKERSVEKMKAELKIEIGELEIRRMKTKSVSTRMALSARINALNEHFALLDADIYEVKRAQSTLRKGVVAYV
jgi:hypothetical protein